MSEQLQSFTAWEAGLKAIGYTLAATSSQGSALFSCEGKPSYRISSFEPNEATACWMRRNGVVDARCADSDDLDYYDRTSDLPEFGLETTADYHADTTHITSSMLKLFSSSPFEFYSTFILGTMPRKASTAQMNLGTICHAMLLDKKTIDEVCIEYPYSCFADGGRLNSKRASEFAVRVSPLIAVKPEMIPTIKRIIESARQSAFGTLLDVHADCAKFETRLEAVIEGVPCKCRPDLHIVLDEQVICPDLKFTATYKPKDFERTARRLGYAIQQAHYTAILEQVYNRPVSFTFWLGETVPPYRFGNRDYDFRSIEIARDNHRDLLRRLKRCRESGDWSDNFQTEMSIAPWDFDDGGESEIDGEEIIVTGETE